jgi:integrase/recombinase XerD
MPPPPLSARYVELVTAYETWLQHNRGRAKATAAKYGEYLLRFGAWFLEPPEQPLLQPRGTSPLECSSEDVQRFCGPVAHEAGLGARGRRPLVAALRGFYAWLEQRGEISGSPAEKLEYPAAGRRLPRAAELEHADAMLMAMDITSFLGVRDAAMLSLLIGCGLRVSGLVALDESQLLWTNDDAGEHLVVRVREKGSRERLVPAPAEVALLVRGYLGHQELAGIDRQLPNGDRVLFVSTNNRAIAPHDYHGERRRITAHTFTQRLDEYGRKAGVPEGQRNPHAFRHLYGTELAEDDVDLLRRQALMGHEDPKSTEIYTRLAMRKLRETVDRSSPMAKLRSPLVLSLREIHKAAAKARSRGPAGA